MHDAASRSYTSAVFLVGLFSLVLVAPQTEAQQRTPFQQAWDAAAPITISGQLVVMHADDFQSKRSELLHMVRDAKTGKSYRLRFERGAPKGLRSGTQVTLRGRARGSEVYLAFADGTSSITAQSTSTSAAVVAGDQKAIVIVANFSDKTVDPLVAGADCSIQAINDRMFSDPLGYTVDNLYRETSGGRVSFSGTTVGPYTLNFASTSACDLPGWTAAAEAQATMDGVNLAEYARKVYVMPSNGCPGAGIGEVGTNPSRAWVFSCDSHRIYAHELGHNLGMQHAATPSDEYGDYTDPMSAMGRLRAVNAPHKEQMGWVTESQILTPTQGGIYDVAPLSLDPTATTLPQVLKINRAGSNEYYYVSYRHATSRFEGNVTAEYMDRVSVHRWAGATEKTYLLAALGDGQSYVDPETGFTVTQLAHGSAYASVQIQQGTSCSFLTPSVTLSPRDQTGAAARTAGYDVTVVNNDSSACPLGMFSVNRTVPSGWTGSLSPSTLQLAPGAAGFARLTVNVPSGAAAGSYGVSVTASDSASPTQVATGSGTYQVVALDTQPPTAPGKLAARVKGNTITLTWLAAADNTGIAGYRISANGTVIATTTATSRVQSNVPAGSYTYSVVAVDAAANVSAPSNSVTVQVSSGGAKRR